MPAFTTTLTERRKADRLEMARRLEAVAAQHGACAESVAARWGARCVTVDIQAGQGLRVSVDLDGESLQPDVHVIPWCIGAGSNARLAPSFGDVNPHHRRKATHVAYGWDALAAEIERGLAAAADGSAFDR